MIRILGCSDHYRHGIDPPVIDDQRPVFLQEMCITKSLQAFKGNDHICLAFFHNGFRYVFSITDKRNHAAAALRHPMHFGKFHIIAAGDRKSS